jgi:hypothetical protein
MDRDLLFADRQASGKTVISVSESLDFSTYGDWPTFLAAEPQVGVDDHRPSQ